MPPEETIAERGRRVAEARLVKIRSGPFYAPLSPRAAQPALTNWTVVSLKSEIETLQCINEAKEKEIRLLKSQLTEALYNYPDEKDVISGPASTYRVKSGKNPPLLLESFSRASSFTLNRVLVQMERTLEVRDIDQVEQSLSRLAGFETKYEEIVRACCVLFRTTPKEASHKQLVRQLLAAKGIDVCRDEVKKNSGVAWTFH
jgi:hypothetical protein